MSSRRLGVLAAILTAVGVSATACGSSKDKPGGGHPADGGHPAGNANEDSGLAADAGGGGDCAGDGGCSCAMDQVCDYTCSSACTVGCLGGLCTAACPAGGCTVDGDFGASAAYDCSGGGCHSDCDNGSACSLDCTGGGCDVACDVGSTCTVACSETGVPCTVTCENGGRATCTGNCTMVGCDQSCVADSTYNPTIDPADFSTVIDNRLFPLPVGAQWHYEFSEESITITVTPQIKTILGVDCVVVTDTVRSPRTGELIEDTLDYFAQDSQGNVWYFGEKTAEYVNGQVASTHGTWEAGVDGAMPGITMYGMLPDIGVPYRQEYYACEAEDMAQVVEVGVTQTVTAGSYHDCIRTRDFSPLEPSTNELKTYCPGVGVVLVYNQNTGENEDELISFTQHVADAGADAH